MENANVLFTVIGDSVVCIQSWINTLKMHIKRYVFAKLVFAIQKQIKMLVSHFLSLTLSKGHQVKQFYP